MPAPVAFPWPTPDSLRGPAVRAVVADNLWKAHLRRFTERWRAAHSQRLPLVAYDDPAQLDSSHPSDRLMDIVEVSSERLTQMANWLAGRERTTTTVALLCRQSLAAAEAQAAAVHLLREAGARLVLASPREMAPLDELFTHLTLGRASSAGPLAELPLPCWGPPWQRPG